MWRSQSPVGCRPVSSFSVSIRPATANNFSSNSITPSKFETKENVLTLCRSIQLGSFCVEAADEVITECGRRHFGRGIVDAVQFAVGILAVQGAHPRVRRRGTFMQFNAQRRFRSETQRHLGPDGIPIQSRNKTTKLIQLTPICIEYGVPG